MAGGFGPRRGLISSETRITDSREVIGREVLAAGDTPTLLDRVEEPLDGIARQDAQVDNTRKSTRLTKEAPMAAHSNSVS